MTTFILSSMIAFALYELLAFSEWPYGQSFFNYCRDTLGLSEGSTRALRKVVQSLIVLVILLAVLTVHKLSSSIEALARSEVSIIFGFVFGTLSAIWVNSVVVHSANEDLSRGQIFAAIGLGLLFILGVLGSEGPGVIRQYAKSLTSLKLGVAELSFSAKEQGGRDRIASTAPSGIAGTYVAGGSNGLQNLTVLNKIIERDREYLNVVFTPKPLISPIADLINSEQFATATIAKPLNCLLVWFRKTADPGPVEKYLSAYSDAFRRLEALNTTANAQDGAMDRAARQAELNGVSFDLIRNGLGMALDILQSTTSGDVLEDCKEWFEIYCKPDKSRPINEQRNYTRECLRRELNELTSPAEASKTDNVRDRLSYLVKNLDEMIAPSWSTKGRGLEEQPYFAISRSSLMTQLGRHEAAAAILDSWLQSHPRSSKERKDEYKRNPALLIRDEWFVLRVRSMLAAYVEEWLEDQNAKAATIVRNEHLRNLQATIDGFKTRLLKADFFKKLNDACRTKCEPVFKRPETCESDEPFARVALWRRLYSSYITMEYTYIHRALEHPDYEKFAETVNDNARRLVNFDLSCGTDQPEPAVVYGQSLLGFAENAVAYARLRAKSDDKIAQQKRLDEAERAVRFGLQIVDDLAREARERAAQPYLKRIAPSFSVSVQEQLKQQLTQIEKARIDLVE
jgi:hypothetical protein